jgi:hypothetical protein
MMKTISVEMPLVKKCDVSNCGYNQNDTCHAKAITIGDHSNPGCDTFLDSQTHIHEKKRIAGVGACKVSSCFHNVDFNCSAHMIDVGYAEDKINCLTFLSKTP